MLKIKAQKAFERSDPGAKEYGTHQSFLLTNIIEDVVGELNYIIDSAERGSLNPEFIASSLKKTRGKLQDALNDKSLSDAGFAGRSNFPSPNYDILNTVINPKVPYGEIIPEIRNIRGE